MTCRAWFCAVALVGCYVLSNEAAAQVDPQAVLHEREKKCDANVAYLRDRLDGITLTSNVLLIAGACISGIGSALAGFLGTSGKRKSAAVIGALGAVLTVVPRTLPDADEVSQKLANADKHRTIGVKFLNQFVFAQPGESLTEVSKYVSARFTECAALWPPENLPDFPKDITKLSEVAPTEAVDRVRGNPTPSAPARVPTQETPPAKKGSQEVSAAPSQPVATAPTDCKALGTCGAQGPTRNFEPTLRPPDGKVRPFIPVPVKAPLEPTKFAPSDAPM